MTHGTMSRGSVPSLALFTWGRWARAPSHRAERTISRLLAADDDIGAGYIRTIDRYLLFGDVTSQANKLRIHYSTYF